MLINVSLVGSKELLAKFGKMSVEIQAALYIKSLQLALMLEAYIKTSKLNGQVLNRVTGALSRSINNKVEKITNGVLARVFSSGDVKYAGIHEYGGQTAAHVIYPKKAQALAFMIGGKMRFAKKVNHPGSKMPERSFMRSGLRDMSTKISTGYKEAVVKAAQGVMR